MLKGLRVAGGSYHVLAALHVSSYRARPLILMRQQLFLATFVGTSEALRIKVSPFSPCFLHAFPCFLRVSSGLSHDSPSFSPRFSMFLLWLTHVASCLLSIEHDAGQGQSADVISTTTQQNTGAMTMFV